MKNRNLIIFAALVALAAGTFYALKRPADQSAPILFAANYPMSGDLAFYGTELRDGMLMAFEDKKADTPIASAFRFDWGDNRFSPKDAVTVFQRQLLMRPTIYSSSLKPQVMAVEKEVEAAGIPHLAWVLDLSPNPQGTTNNFRTWVSFKLETDVFFEHAKARGAKNIVVCYVSLPSSEAAYGQYLTGRLQTELGSTVTIERYNPDVAADDFKNIAARIAAKKPDLIMINGFIPHMVGIVRGLRPLGAITDGNTMAALDMLDAAGALSAEEAEGIVVAAPPFLVNPTAEQKDWQTRFESRYGRKPSYHAAFAYDAGLTLLDAAGRLDLPADPGAWLAAILATDIEGVTGPIRYGSDQSLVTELIPAIYRQGVLTPLR